MDFIIQMLDLFYANKWMYKKLKARKHRGNNMDYESCDVYKIKGQDGMCTGGDEQCNECPCFVKYTKVCEEEKKRMI